MDLGLNMSLRNRCRWLVAGRWGLSRVISHCPQICSLLKLGFPATLRFPATIHKLGMMPDTNHTDCYRTGDNLLLNAQYYHQ